MHMLCHAPLCREGKTKFPSRNLATALLEDTTPGMDGTLRKHGGDIPAGRPMLSKAPQASSQILHVWTESPFTFLKSGADVGKVPFWNGTETCGMGESLLLYRFCFTEAARLRFGRHFVCGESYKVVFVRFLIGGREDGAK